MVRWIGAAVVMAALSSGGSVAIDSASATALPTTAQNQQTGKATDGGRRPVRHQHRTGNRPFSQPVYYDRPYYYAPAPFFPFLGLGYGPWW